MSGKVEAAIARALAYVNDGVPRPIVDNDGIHDLRDDVELLVHNVREAVKTIEQMDRIIKDLEDEAGGTRLRITAEEWAADDDRARLNQGRAPGER